MLKVSDKLVEIHQIHNWLDLCAETFRKSNASDRITVDLSQLNYISPLGCTTLVSTLRFLDKYFYLDTIVPHVPKIEDTNVVGYIERMNFFKYCPDDVRSTFENELDMEFLYSRYRNNKKDFLNEITLCSSDTDVEVFDSSLKNILRNKEVAPNQISNISRIVTELGLNSVEHGKDKGEVSCYYCIQSYSNGKMGIAICDSGIGIVKSLKPHIKSENDDDVVRQAIFTKASSRGKGRGKGLPDVRNVALLLDNAEFYLRTHKNAYQVFSDEVKSLYKGKYFFGTYYYIVVSA
ncbi:ATP-binding protein [Paenibacillus sp. GXUN7292]|uniref:ATP-binding protein n=1 Tax=Paenibacillus sp. GXUN7292 TaxID=3422499 RepID=UPI003D7E577E